MADLNGRAFERRGRTLVPCDVMADELLERLPIGKPVLVDIRRPRSVQQHRLFFALLRIVVRGTGRWPNEERLLDDLKIATGHAELRINPLTKQEYWCPGSISFGSMKQDEFQIFYEQCLAILAVDVLATAPRKLQDEVNALLEDRKPHGDR